jgi:hypothetical protein
MAVSAPERLEVRLDPERRKKLQEMTEAGAGPLSEITRHGIDLAYEEFRLARRIEAARRIAEMNVEDPPEPEEMNRQLAERYGPLS